MSDCQPLHWAALLSNALESLAIDGYSKKFYRRAFELEISSDLLDQILKLLPDGYDGAQEYYTQGHKCDLAIVNEHSSEAEVVVESKCQIYLENKQINSQIADIEKRKSGSFELYCIMWTVFVNKLDVEDKTVKPKYFDRLRNGKKRKVKPEDVSEIIESRVGKILKSVYVTDPFDYQGYNISIMGTLVRGF